MLKLWHKAIALAHHPYAHHSHHFAYIIYYGIAAVDERGARFWICSALLVFAVLTGIEGFRNKEE